MRKFLIGAMHVKNGNNNIKDISTVPTNTTNKKNLKVASSQPCHYCGSTHINGITARKCSIKHLNAFPRICTQAIKALRRIQVEHFLLEDNNKFIIFDNGRYIIDEDDMKIRQLLIAYLKSANYFNYLKTRDINEIIAKYKDDLNDRKVRISDFSGFMKEESELSVGRVLFFSLENGVLRYEVDSGIKTMINSGLEKFKFTSKLNISYDPKNISKTTTLSTALAVSLPLKAHRDNLMLWMAYSLMENNHKWEIILFWYGEGGDGKSTFVSSWTNIFPKSRQIELGIRNNRFSNSLIYDADIIIGKIEMKKLEGVDLMGLLKGIASREPEVIEQKYKKSFEGIIKGKIVVTANYLPSLEVRSDYRRIVFINSPSKPMNPDPNLKEKLQKELTGWFDMVLDYIPIYYKELPILISQIENLSRKRYAIVKDPFKVFCDQALRSKPGNKLPTKDIHKAYELYRKKNYFDELSLISIGKKIGDYFGLKSDKSYSKYNRYDGLEINDEFMKLIDKNWC